MGVRKATLRNDVLDCLLYYIKTFFMTWCEFMGLMCVWKSGSD